MPDIQFNTASEAGPVRIGGHQVQLTNLEKPFWPDLGLTKGDLITYYRSVSKYLLPHIKDRAMVMKRYPNGAYKEFFFMKRAPKPRPDWIKTCKIKHESGNIIDFPLINDTAALLWVINLGCIDLNPWYARCDDTSRPDYLHFDLDPTKTAGINHVLEAALYVNEALEKFGISSFPKTTGSRGIHIYVPIKRGPLQKEVWQFAKDFAQAMASLHPKLITAEYRVAKRPDKHVLVDYNQNAWGRTLSSVYSVRPRKGAPVSMPVTYKEIEKGFQIEDFNIFNALKRIKKKGDLWRDLLKPKNLFDLGKVI